VHIWHADASTGDPQERNTNECEYQKTVALVVALPKLHNFCIDNYDHRYERYTASGEWQYEVIGAAPLVQIRTDDSHLNYNNVGAPEQLMDGGNHNNNIGGRRGQYNRQRQ
jgi:hypothetical protein